MAEPRYIIYGLTDPRTGLVRYIGKSQRGMERPLNHGQPRYLIGDRSYKGNWIRSLRALGLEHGIVVIEECSAPDVLPDRERWWIAFARAWGLPLTNLTDGGEGAPGCHPNENGIRRRKETMLRLWQDPERRAAFLAVHVGRRMPDSARAILSDKARGRVISAETRAKIAAAGKRRYESPEERLLQSARLKGRVGGFLGKHHSEESRQKMSGTHRGRPRRPLSPETRAKIGESHRLFSIANAWGCAL